jgi:amino acid adenylation domain-containing protein
MRSHNKLDCMAIGEGTLLIQCAEILSNCGHRICGVITSDAAVKQWALEKDMPCIEPADDLGGFMRRQPFDYLFSIANEHVLPRQILQVPRLGAINYHDALLPRYAGTHATSWAIMQRETIHGITWHLMNERVDAGAILKQQQVQIADDETALTLNAKCYEAAIQAFAELVEDLTRGELRPIKEASVERTFFPRYKRPPAACVLSFERDADDLFAFIRALNFGHYPNPLGIPKLPVGKDYVVLSEIDVLNSMSDDPTGTVLEIGRDFVKVSTSGRDVALRKLLAIDGEPLSIPTFVQKFGVTVGHQLGVIDPRLAERITTFNKSICKHEAFWVERLESLHPAEIPSTLSKRSNGKTAQYASVAMPIPEEITPVLKERYGVGRLCDLLLAAFGVYLSRVGSGRQFDVAYTGLELQQDVAGLEGLFAQHVPVRLEIDAARSFSKIFETVGKEVEFIRQRGTYARDVVIRYPQLRRSMAQGKKGHELSIVVKQVSGFDCCLPAPGSVLTLAVMEEAGICRWIYRTGVLEEDNVASMSRQFATLLRGIAADPDLSVAQLPLLTDEERRLLLVEWNDTAAEYPRNKCIHQLFEAQVEQSPDTEAVVFQNHRLTYRELNSRANQLAHYLRKCGVRREVLVGVCLERSEDLLVALLGILKAGGAYLPLDMEYPQERLSLMLDDTQAAVVLTQRTLANRLPKHSAQVVCLDGDWDTIAQESEKNPTCGVTPEDLVYVIYTSGSTGTPKGVLIPHRALVNHSTAIIKRYGLQSTDRVLQFASISFDVAAEEIFPSLISGASVILRPRQIPSIADFLLFLEKEELTVINLPTPYWHELVAQLARTGALLPLALRIAIAGSEKALSQDLAAWRKLVGDRVRWINAYGPTEATITATTYEPALYPESVVENAAVPIGRPLDNAQVYLLDNFLNPVPVGVAGELYIGGDGLARGYLNRTTLTAERFIPNPFSTEPGTRLYKTGDLARYLPDGNLEFLSRTDDQLKVRGFRVEPGEIEGVLSRHPSVGEVIVMAREDLPGENRLVAYVVARRETAIGNGELRRFLTDKLPHYMVPSCFMLLDALPLATNGKVDRLALPVPDRNQAAGGESFVAPQDEFELRLVKIWEEILPIRPIGIKDDFFDLGGDSLLALRLFSEIDKAFGESLPLATLFQAPNVEKLADLLRGEGSSKAWSSLVSIQPDGSKPPFFCIHAGGGNVLFYRDLARRLGPDQPLYGLQPQGLDGKLPRHTTAEQMAAHYISEIKTLQPKGPYYIGAASFGGPIAFEMAQQLHARGERVSLLALFDAYGPGYPKLLPGTTVLRSKVDRFRQRIEHHVGSLLMLESKERLRYLREKTFIARKAFKRRMRRRRREIARKFYERWGRPVPTALRATQETIYQSVSDYVPGVYPGKLTLFRASTQPVGIYPDPLLGWGGLASGGLEIHEVPGFHGSIVAEPRVRFLAEVLRTCLDSAQEPEPAMELDTTLLSHTLITQPPISSI